MITQTFDSMYFVTLFKKTKRLPYIRNGAVSQTYFEFTKKLLYHNDLLISKQKFVCIIHLKKHGVEKVTTIRDHIRVTFFLKDAAKAFLSLFIFISAIVIYLFFHQL